MVGVDSERAESRRDYIQVSPTEVIEVFWYLVIGLAACPRSAPRVDDDFAQTLTHGEKDFHNQHRIDPNERLKDDPMLLPCHTLESSLPTCRLPPPT